MAFASSGSVVDTVTQVTQRRSRPHQQELYSTRLKSSVSSSKTLNTPQLRSPVPVEHLVHLRDSSFSTQRDVPLLYLFVLMCVFNIKSEKNSMDLKWFSSWEILPWKRLVYKEEFMGKGMNFGSLESTYAHDCIWNRSPIRTYWAAQGTLLNTL